jgi:hypothetical protein
MPKKTDPKKLIAARTALRWTFDDVVFEARRRGHRIAINTIRNLEAGTSGGQVETLALLADLYGKKRVDDLMTDE